MKVLSATGLMANFRSWVFYHNKKNFEKILQFLGPSGEGMSRQAF